jgi:hypothetical protein
MHSQCTKGTALPEVSDVLGKPVEETFGLPNVIL